MDSRQSHREYVRRWQKTESGKASRKKWRLRNYATEEGRLKHLVRMRRYRAKSSTKIKVLEYQRNRNRIDPSFRLRKYLQTRIWIVLDGHKKVCNTMDFLGCSIEDFWIYLESKFQNGMTRQNYGRVWHVDHIMPCAIFDLSKPEHQKRCFHFSNLQPLFAEENQRKSSKITTNQFNLL